MAEIVKKLVIEQADNDKIYLIVGSVRRRVISKTALRISVGDFIRELE